MRKQSFLLLRPRDPKHLLKDLRAKSPQFTWDRWSDWSGIDRTSLVEIAESPVESVAICRLLERTIEQPRLLRNYLRHFPTLNHRALAYDPLLVSRLAGLTQKRTGVTFVTADSAVARAFTAYVFGHEFELASNMREHAFGVSAYGDDVFVPFSGLMTLQCLDGQKRRHQLAKFESQSRRALTSPTIFIDLGISNRLLIERFISMSTSRHVIVAADPDEIARLSGVVSHNAHLIEVCSKSRHCLSLAIHSLPRNWKKF